MILKKGKEDLEEFNYLKGIIFLLFSINLIALSIYDLKYKAVPDYLLLFALISSFFITDFDFFDSLTYACIAGGVFVLLNFLVTFYIQNIKSRFLKDESLKTQQALGEGDIPLIASFAVILGLEKVVIAILFAALIAIIQAIYLKFKKNEREIPFIPSLAFGFFIEYFFQISNMFKEFY